MLLQSKILPDSLQQIIPGISGWVDSMGTNPIGIALQNSFAQIEVVHFMGLFALSACVILTSLRLIGVGLVELPASEIYRNTKIWLHIGVVAAVGSGLLLGLSSASKLYNSSAFLYKMLAMIAAIIFSYAVMAPAAKADGEVRGGARIGLIIGVLVLLLGVTIMIVKPISNVGSFHVIYGATLIAALAVGGRWRWILLGGVAAAVILLQVVTHGYLKDPFSEPFMLANKIFMWSMAAFVFGIVALNILGKTAQRDSNTLARFVGYAAILSWVMTGAGGRWIGLS